MIDPLVAMSTEEIAEKISTLSALAERCDVSAHEEVDWGLRSEFVKLAADCREFVAYLRAELSRRAN